MKKRGVLQNDLSRVIATLGHTDSLVIKGLVFMVAVAMDFYNTRR